MELFNVLCGNRIGLTCVDLVRHVMFSRRFVYCGWHGVRIIFLLLSIYILARNSECVMCKPSSNAGNDLSDRPHLILVNN